VPFLFPSPFLLHFSPHVPPWISPLFLLGTTFPIFVLSHEEITVPRSATCPPSLFLLEWETYLFSRELFDLFENKCQPGGYPRLASRAPVIEEKGLCSLFSLLTCPLFPPGVRLSSPEFCAVLWRLRLRPPSTVGRNSLSRISTMRYKALGYPEEKN